MQQFAGDDAADFVVNGADDLEAILYLLGSGSLLIVCRFKGVSAKGCAVKRGTTFSTCLKSN